MFSDKTGTLTSNEMQLRMIAIKGVPYGTLDFRSALHNTWHGTGSRYRLQLGRARPMFLALLLIYLPNNPLASALLSAPGTRQPLAYTRKALVLPIQLALGAAGG